MAADSEVEPEVRVRRIPVLLVLCTAGAITLAGCGSSSSSGGPAATQPSSASTAPAPGSSGTAASDVIGAVTMVKGKPQGGAKRISIKAGKPAVLMVTSDVATEIHVHGADRHIQVPANQPTAVDVSEAAPGSYEVEDHASDALLVQLRVS
jgi:hypothetical protein